MNKAELTKLRLQFLLDKEGDFSFPEMLVELRKLHGLTRRGVCKDLELSEMRMFWIEHGCFKKDIHDGTISLLASYYGIDPNLLLKKYVGFTNSRKSQADHQPKKKRKAK